MLREINNIYVPTSEEYDTLGKIVNNKEKMYDYIIAKYFEFDLWAFYQSDIFRKVPIDMQDSFSRINDKVLTNELLKALIRMYPEILLDKTLLSIENQQLAIDEIIKNKQNENFKKIVSLNIQGFSINEFLEYLLEKIKDNLELLPRYRFEYRRYDDDARRGYINQIDFIFGGTINSQNIKSIKSVQSLQNLLYVDPMYITKVSDEEYQRIYSERKVREEDIPYLKNRDTRFAIDNFVKRYKIDCNVWARNYDKELSDKEYETKCKKLIRQR